jgi:hypothetical protein
VRQNRLACPRCGFETGFAPLIITARGGADACPMCDRLLPAVTAYGLSDNGLRRMEHENPTLLDYLIEKLNQRAAHQRTVHWVALLTGSMSLALVAYLLFRPLL